MLTVIRRIFPVPALLLLLGACAGKAPPTEPPPFVESERVAELAQAIDALGDAVDQVVDQVSNTGGPGTEDERIRFLRDFIADLDPLNRALMLLYLEAYSHREISSILGISETNVATKISRLKQRVRQQHTQTLEEDSPHGTR